MKEIKIKATFTENILGTSTSNEDLFLDFIASKAPDASTLEEEVAAIGVEEVADKSMTIFPRTPEGNPFIYDYQIKGFFKDAAGMLRKIPSMQSAKIKAYKKEIDGLIFVSPRKIEIATDRPIKTCQRPLRASTPQGERIALAISEEIEAGATIEFTIKLLKDDLEAAIIEWLDYGELRGLGQWRNSGKGKFTYEIIK